MKNNFLLLKHHTELALDNVIVICNVINFICITGLSVYVIFRQFQEADP